jgi:antirestriction protein ArdC
MNIKSYERITERIETLLAAGVVPWHKPWKASTGLPRKRRIIARTPGSCIVTR